MTNKTIASQNKLPYLMAILAAGVMIFLSLRAHTSAKRLELTHYMVKVSPTVSDVNLERARLALEESLFESVNHLVTQDSTLTYSKALDNVLPMSEVAANLPGGLVVVVNNYGQGALHNVQVNIALGVPFKKYKIFSSETFSVIEEDQPNGILKVRASTLAPREKLQIAVLLSGDYPVRLTALRTEDLQAPTLPTSRAPSMSDIEILTTQTAVAIYNQNHNENLLQFQIKYDVDNIQPTILVSSDEMQSCFHGTSLNEAEEKNLFFETFLQ